ncbi:MAG: hypothetical protein Q9212_005605 [Teloschistes hypoglaucus]
MSYCKAPIHPPTAPLTILTFSPSTLYAFFPTLLALADLIRQISSLQPSHVHPQQHNASIDQEAFVSETFTLIAGTGLAGGFLALFLGRFRLSCMGALDEWHELAETGAQINLGRFHFTIRQCLAWATGTKLKRASQMSLAQKKRIHRLREATMFLEADEETRCRHVIVVGAAEKGFEKGRKKTKIMKMIKKKEEKSAGRAIHRSYDVADEAATDPRTTKIFSDVLQDLCEAEPYASSKDAMEASLGEKSQEGAYRTVALALDEVWALYGKDVRITAIVDVGDRFEKGEKGADLKEVARCIFEGQAAAAPVGSGGGDEENELRDPSVRAGGEKKTAPGAEGKDDADSERTKVCGGEEDSVQRDVEAKLREVYGEEAPPFYRIKARNIFH